jgi:hypothetical protein
MLLMFAMMLFLPTAVAAIWRIRAAGRLLLLDAAFIASSSLLYIHDKDVAMAPLALALPMALTGLLLLKKPLQSDVEAD